MADYSKLAATLAFSFINTGSAVPRTAQLADSIEGFNRQLRKVTKSKALFPNDEALRKTLYLTTQDIVKKRSMPYHDWGETYGQSAIEFGERAQID